MKVGSAADPIQEKSLLIRYEVELVNKTVNFLKRIGRKIYKIT